MLGDGTKPLSVRRNPLRHEASEAGRVGSIPTIVTGWTAERSTVAFAGTDAFFKEVGNMLVLSRKERETIKIGDEILITITRVNGERVKIGIEAPKELRVIRGELQKRKTEGEDSNV